MLRQIGYTKYGKLVFQNFENGDVTVKQNESDAAGIYYPYAEWLRRKAEIAEMETVKEEYNPMSEAEKMQRRAQAAKAAARIALEMLKTILKAHR